MNLGPFDELVPASTSSPRKALMEGLGLPFRAVAPGVDEDAPAGTPPQHAVAMLGDDLKKPRREDPNDRGQMQGHQG